MTFCSYNIRGLNKKLSFVKDFLQNNRLGLIALMETHVKQESAAFVSSVVSARFNWLHNYDYHSNGRIWVGWDPNRWSITKLSASAQHISCSVANLETNTNFYVSFVYGLNNHVDRRSLWTDLINFQQSICSNDIVQPWVLLGDFNVCLSLDDMNGGSQSFTVGMREFKDFAENIACTDLSFTGNLLTWWDSSITSPVFRKLDRVLVNESWLSEFRLSRAHFPARGLSDHSPAFVFLGINGERIMKPFQVFQHLIEHPKFKDTVEAAWNIDISGDPWFVLTSKLKNVKLALKTLNREHGNLHDQMIIARNAFLDFQESLPQVPSAAQRLEEERLCNIFTTALHSEETLLKQKSRVNWLHLGDANNKFFFNQCNNRWNSNKILMLVDDHGTELKNHKDISINAVNYFKAIMGEERSVTPIDPNVSVPSVSDEQKDMLSRDFTSEEIYKVFKQLPKHKCPGPDGFTSEFYLAAWQIIGTDVTRAILYFFDSLHLPRIVNSTAIALVPKTTCPSHISHYRPISCCNTLYKCIAKLLALRFKKVLPSLISPCQSAFVPGRRIGDNIMLAQALCRDYHLEAGIPRCAIKIDLHKAFDMMNWQFIFEAMNAMGFPQKFISWIKKCITSCMSSVKINGALEGYFQSKSGIRQGDPLSPYLFVLGMEVMSAYMKTDLSNNANFSFHWRTKELKLTHLIFADDILLFCKGDEYSISAIINSFERFSCASGLRANPTKCQIFFCNVQDMARSNILGLTGYQQGSLPVKYLGLPLISSRLKASDCVPLVNRLCARIESWTTKSLRFTGRIQLIKAVLFSIQGYWSSYLFLPKSVLKCIQSCLSKFLWGGNYSGHFHHKVAWSDCCKPKVEGGLGLRDVFEWNTAAIFLQIWRVSNPCTSSLWIAWVRKCLFKNKFFWTASTPSSCPWNIKKMLNYRDAALAHITYEISGSSSLSFWHDPWCGRQPLIKRFGPGLISEIRSTYLDNVSTFISGTTWAVIDSNHVQAMELRNLLSSCHIHRGDAILWDGQKVVNISVVWNSIRAHQTAPPWLKAIWHPFSIPKCSFFLWLALRNRLLTKDRMISFGFNVSPTCVLCRSANESAEHLFSSCPMAFMVIRSSPVPLDLNWTNWLAGNFFRDSPSSFQQHLGYLYISAMIHVIWFERNRRMHEGRRSQTVEQLIWQTKGMVREKLFMVHSFKKKLRRHPHLISSLY